MMSLLELGIWENQLTTDQPRKLLFPTPCMEIRQDK